ncbi:unnamed protein product [Cuscuta epithymum]|uniref:Uncharacterized protein n=1 Tax=Cuscuta epithymum TaxID=186058 RepID=A0AAV0EYG8_9ASTE|nr:unnamed protein product [Cuscuta epithymum]
MEHGVRPTQIEVWVETHESSNAEFCHPIHENAATSHSIEEEENEDRLSFELDDLYDSDYDMNETMLDDLDFDKFIDFDVEYAGAGLFTRRVLGEYSLLGL